MSSIFSAPNKSADVEAAIAVGVTNGKFDLETRVDLFEASSTGTRMFELFCS